MILKTTEEFNILTSRKYTATQKLTGKLLLVERSGLEGVPVRIDVRSGIIERAQYHGVDSTVLRDVLQLRVSATSLPAVTNNRSYSIYGFINISSKLKTKILGLTKSNLEVKEQVGLATLLHTPGYHSHEFIFTAICFSRALVLPYIDIELNLAIMSNLGFNTPRYLVPEVSKRVGKRFYLDTTRVDYVAIDSEIHRSKTRFGPLLTDYVRVGKGERVAYEGNVV